MGNVSRVTGNGGCGWCPEVSEAHHCTSLYLGIGLSKLLKFGKSGGSTDSTGVVLLSNRTLNKDHVTSGDEGGITLISRRPLDASTDSLDGKFHRFLCVCMWERERER